MNLTTFFPTTMDTFMNRLYMEIYLQLLPQPPQLQFMNHSYMETFSLIQSQFQNQGHFFQTMIHYRPPIDCKGPGFLNVCQEDEECPLHLCPPEDPSSKLAPAKPKAPHQSFHAPGHSSMFKIPGTYFWPTLLKAAPSHWQLSVHPSHK